MPALTSVWAAVSPAMPPPTIATGGVLGTDLGRRTQPATPSAAGFVGRARRIRCHRAPTGRRSVFGDREVGVPPHEADEQTHRRGPRHCLGTSPSIGAANAL